MRQVTGTSICIFPKEEAAKYGFQNDEVVQVVGSLPSVQDALYHITGRLREKIFPTKPPFSGTAAPPYPPPFPEMHPPHFRPRLNPNSSSPYPSPAGPFHGIDRSAVPSHSHDHQPSFSYGMDHIGPPNLDRGPYPYNGERPGHGPPFERSPRSWTPQPFSSGNPMAGADPGSGLAIRNGPQGSGNQAPSLPSKPVEIVIPQKLLTYVHGEYESNLIHIRQISGANVHVYDPTPGVVDGVVVISGAPDQIRSAQILVHAFIFHGKTNSN
uniref:KH domain-containing protein n=1 Tax=Rhizophora mucronata TaxID=61149 RepID=A0A2P2MXD1_RHIMU